MIDLPPQPGYEQTIQAIVECDIARTDIRIGYEDELQSDAVTIGDLGDVTDAKLRCLKAAIHPFYILTIENEGQQAAFYEFSRREDRPRDKAAAKEWLASRNLLDHLPDFDPSESVEQFASALEAACGLDSGSALILWGSATLAVRPEFVLSPDFDATSESIFCLTQMFEASDANEHGIRFVFIGNEAYAKEEKE